MIETNCSVTNKLNDELTRTDSDTDDHQSGFTTTVKISANSQCLVSRMREG